MVRLFVLSRMPVIIGERINPTGEKRLKEALKAGDMDYVPACLGTDRQGAQVLDVNVGVPGIDEPALLEKGDEGHSSPLRPCRFRLIRVISKPWDGPCAFITDGLSLIL